MQNTQTPRETSQKPTIAQANAPRLEVVREEAFATTEKTARRGPLRLAAVVSVTTVAVLVLYVALSRDMSQERGQTLLMGVHAVPALVTFALGWRLRDVRRALASAALVMLAVTVAMLAYVVAQQGFEDTVRGLTTAYAVRELSRFVGIGLAAGVAGAGVRRLISGAYDGRSLEEAE